MSDDQAIRDVFTGWVHAIQSQDIQGVVANHDSNIVMFDVPPPLQRGARHRRVPQVVAAVLRVASARGRSFELIELDVVAGADVAFAYALLRCGTRGSVRLRTPTTGCASPSGYERSMAAGSLRMNTIRFR